MKGARATVVVGCQWGDEGKGKIVDILSESSDVIARYQGGANAGHTVHVDDDEFVLHQIPSGILHSGKRCLLGNGVVLDPIQFFREYDALVARGIDVEGRVGISDRAHLLLPWHAALDRASEDSARERIGTTGRGIGPAYEEKVGRRGIRVAELKDMDRVHDMALSGLERARRGMAQLDDDAILGLEKEVEVALALRERLLPLACDAGAEVMAALEAGQQVLLEGAQGTALDLDHGTYPFVTSSNTTAAAAATGVGIGPTRIGAVLGVVKAYTTRVGNGPLPSACNDEMDQRLRDLGGEYGATTGRPRRCGWFDAVLGRYAARVNGLTSLAVTKLDVLDTLPEIPVAVAYRLPDGEIVHDFPADTRLLDRVEPVLEMMPGWEACTEEATTVAELPANARRYLDRIEELTRTPIQIISVGTRRRQAIQV